VRRWDWLMAREEPRCWRQSAMRRPRCAKVNRPVTAAASCCCPPGGTCRTCLIGRSSSTGDSWPHHGPVSGQFEAERVPTWPFGTV